MSFTASTAPNSGHYFFNFQQLNKSLLIFLFFLLGGAVRLSAQVNLVPNPSFELYDTCPYDLGGDGQIYRAVPWFQPDTCYGNTTNSSSSDFFNTCSIGYWSVPSNGAGYQYPRTGNGYAGIAVVYGYPDSIGGREYIEVKLTEALRAGELYCIEYYVALSGILATDAIQLAFSDTPVYNHCYLPISLIPAVTNYGNIVKDTTSWSLISDQYLAHGGEQYVIIGDFDTNYNTVFDSLNSPAGDAAYYFIDDVSVSLCETEFSSINVFTPNGDGINDLFFFRSEGLKTYKCIIYNRWGNEISRLNDQVVGWDGKNSNNQLCPDGVYYYVISGRSYDDTEHVYSGFVQLLR